MACSRSEQQRTVSIVVEIGEIAPVLEDQLENVRVTLPGGEVQRCTAVDGAERDVDTHVNENADDGSVASKRGDVERGVGAVGRGGVGGGGSGGGGGGLVLEEEADESRSALKGDEVQGRDAVVVLGVDIGTVVEEDTDEGLVAVKHDGHVQGGQATIALGVDGGAVGEEELGEGRLGEANGVVESCVAGNAGSGGARRGRVDIGGVGQVEDQAEEGRVALPGGPLQGGEAEGVLQG